MKATIRATPRFYFVLTSEQVALLMRLSSQHYDARCKAAGCVGGFLYGWKNHTDWAQESKTADAPLTATWDNLDTALKILEGAHYQGEQACWPVALELQRFFVACYHATNKFIAPLEFPCESC